MVVCGDGPDLVWMVGRQGPGAPPDSEEVLGLAAASFQFAHHSGAKTREALRLYKDAGGLFQVSYPQSWTVETNRNLLPDKSGADFRITAASDTAAYVRVEGDRRHAPDQTGQRRVFEIAVEQVEESGIEIQKLEPIPAGKGGGEKERWAGECKLKSGPGQIALLFRRGAGSWLAATMISPAKEINPFAWMRAKRFYEIIAASLRPAA